MKTPHRKPTRRRISPAGQRPLPKRHENEQVPCFIIQEPNHQAYSKIKTMQTTKALQNINNNTKPSSPIHFYFQPHQYSSKHRRKNSCQNKEDQPGTESPCYQSQSTKTRLNHKKQRHHAACLSKDKSTEAKSKNQKAQTTPILHFALQQIKYLKH